MSEEWFTESSQEFTEGFSVESGEHPLPEGVTAWQRAKSTVEAYEREHPFVDFDQEEALAHYTELMKLIHVGAYQERDQDGNYGEDGIERAADGLIYRAAQLGLQFVWHKEGQYYRLSPMSAEEIAAFKAATEEA